ncbi:HAD-IA family hydrolase [Bradyrhizobium sp. OAE829]|uniref:HAD family hydrolase n=1 Tax=Bradyrhizobium sp. OAE829 TaxID=2663807 RepID=UPI00178A527D
MFSGFIFDVEGTLVDCIPQTLKSLQEAIERYGPPVPYNTLQLYSGLDGDQTLQLVVPDAPESVRKDILTMQARIYRETYLNGVQPFEGIRDVFQSLVRQGGRIALATDCKGPELKHYLSLLDVDEFVTAKACGDDVEHGKPDPRLIGLALSKLGLSGPQSVMVGDTPYDAEAALEAGASAAGVLTGGFSSEALLDAGCFAVHEDLRALLPSLVTANSST